MFILWTVNNTYKINPMLFCMAFFELACLYNIITGIVCIKNSKENKQSGIILLITGLLQAMAAVAIIKISNTVCLLLAIILTIILIIPALRKLINKKSIFNIIELIGTLGVLIALILYLIK